jgi:superfamily II DNA helicase RecQ
MPPMFRVVVYAEDIYQMRSYSEESGCGGRDDERSEAIVVVPAGKQEELQNKIARAKAQTQREIRNHVIRPWKTKQWIGRR